MEYMQREQVILVDVDDTELGPASKVASHLTKYGPLLHRAFSVFLFDSEGRMLLQRRASEKITFPDHWTNTCCSHPLHTEFEMGTDMNPSDSLLGVKRAVVRKLEHELGIPPEQLPLSSLHYLTRIHYIANSDPTWGEHEIDYVFFVQADVTLEPNPNEVREVSYMDEAEVAALFSSSEDSELQVTPWARHIVQQFVFDWWKDLGDETALLKNQDTVTIHRMGECAEPEWSDPSDIASATDKEAVGC